MQNFDNPSGVRPIELFMCSVSKKIGYTDGRVCGRVVSE